MKKTIRCSEVEPYIFLCTAYRVYSFMPCLRKVYGTILCAGVLPQ